MQFGFPELTDSFLEGQDLLYTQFNDINFYVEDTDQEYFYFHVLKNLFPSIKIEKIFPLNGKKNVTDAAKANLGDKSKIYLVDLDFDEILGLKESVANLFYLERYSIENYLFAKEALFELFKEDNPKIRTHEIEAIFSYESLINECRDLLSKLACTFLIIKKYSLGLDYLGLNPPRDFDITNPIAPKFKQGSSEIPVYFTLVENRLKRKDGRFTLNSKLKEFNIYFNTLSKALANIPGKYLINYIKFRIGRLINLTNVTQETFTIRLAKNSDLQDLNYLKNAVLNYIS
ncbi:DUF4435 domain-containing protein [Pontibacter pudoricolor]|uniref:DUF4435 domain-containing protein n=1 Tax=Pontibacter pudoricolor TaxID=2694930 RepID=UPI001391DFE1|nr:DUF4435 domain-containing protein [Pontibacter pudoricolor]